MAKRRQEGHTQRYNLTSALPGSTILLYDSACNSYETS